MLSKIHPQQGPSGLHHLLSLEALGKRACVALAQAVQDWRQHPGLAERPVRLATWPGQDLSASPCAAAWQALPGVSWCVPGAGGLAPDAWIWAHPGTAEVLAAVTQEAPARPVLALHDGGAGSVLEALACLAWMATTHRPWHEQQVLLLGDLRRSVAAQPLLMALGMLGVPRMTAHAPSACLGPAWSSLGVFLSRPQAWADALTRPQALEGANVIWLAPSSGLPVHEPVPEPAALAQVFGIWGQPEEAGRHDACLAQARAQGVLVEVLDAGQPDALWAHPALSAQVWRQDEERQAAWTLARKAALLGALSMVGGPSWMPV